MFKAFVMANSLYVIWVLFGVVAFVSHLGQDAQAVGYERAFQKFVPASGNPAKN